MALVYILLFLEFFYLKFKSDDFVNFNSVIINNIKKNIIGGRLFFPGLNTRNKLSLYNNIARLLRFFVGYFSGNNVSTGAILKAGF